MNTADPCFETRLKALRKERRMSASKLAQYLGLTSSSIYNYEEGKCLPDIAVIIRLCKLFGCSTDYLLLGKDDKQVETYSKTAHDCAKIIDLLEDFEKEFLFVLLDGMALKRKEILGHSKTANYEDRLLQSLNQTSSSSS